MKHDRPSSASTGPGFGASRAVGVLVRCGGIISAARLFTGPPDENSRLKRLVADLSLDKHMLSEALRKKSLRLARRRELAQWFHGTFQVSCARACRLAQFGRASWYRKSRAKDQSALRMRIRESDRGLGTSGSGCCCAAKAGSSIASGCAACIVSMDCNCGCTSGGGNTSPSIADRRQSLRGPPSAGAWICA